MQLEQALTLLEPSLEVSIENEEEFLAFEQMINTSFDCFLISVDNNVFYDTKSLKTPVYAKVYKVDCNFYKALVGKTEDIKIVHPKLNKVWLSPTDTRADFAKVLEDIKTMKLTGFLEIKSKFLEVDGYIYFKNGDVVNAKFGDLDKEPAVSFLISKISDKVVTMNFYKIPEELVDIYAARHKLLFVKEEDEITSLDFDVHLKEFLTQGLFPSGYFHIYLKNNKKLFSIINDEMVETLEIYEPFFLSVFSLEFVEGYIDIFNFIKSYKPANVYAKPTSADKNFVFFCPMCWNTINQDDIVCTHCGYNLENFIKLPYETKLIIALNHPIANYRITALNVIKSKNLSMAKPFIRDIILSEDNPFVIQAAINTLLTLDENACSFFKHVLEIHEYTVVKRYIEDVYRRYCV
jgi:hypothetical protein